MPPTNHRTTRAFLPSNQSSLDTFLARTRSTPSRSDIRSPPLPSAIQSNLLTVGMRIRKSVPEGYKTHKLGFHSIASAEIRLDETADTGAGEMRGRELQPFCGLLKVGGYAAQESSSGYNMAAPIPTSAFAIATQEFDFPSSSQESITSTLSTDSMPKRNPAKRGFSPTADDDNEDAEAGAPAHISTTMSSASRAIAQPTSRRRRSPRLAQRQASFQTSLSFNPAPVADFDEAEFFKAEEWREEMDVENW